ncbi:hypothetical protein V8E36_003739 [Tilletia maclaganii]
MSLAQVQQQQQQLQPGQPGQQQQQTALSSSLSNDPAAHTPAHELDTSNILFGLNAQFAPTPLSTVSAAPSLSVSVPYPAPQPGAAAASSSTASYLGVGASITPITDDISFKLDVPGLSSSVSSSSASASALPVALTAAGGNPTYQPSNLTNFASALGGGHLTGTVSTPFDTSSLTFGTPALGHPQPGAAATPSGISPGAGIGAVDQQSNGLQGLDTSFLAAGASNPVSFDFPSLPDGLLDEAPEYEYSAHTKANVFEAAQDYLTDIDGARVFDLENFDPNLAGLGGDETLWSTFADNLDLTLTAAGPSSTSLQGPTSLVPYPQQGQPLGSSTSFASQLNADPLLMASSALTMSGSHPHDHHQSTHPHAHAFPGTDALNGRMSTPAHSHAGLAGHSSSQYMTSYLPPAGPASAQSGSNYPVVFQQQQQTSHDSTYLPPHLPHYQHQQYQQPYHSQAAQQHTGGHGSGTAHLDPAAPGTGAGSGGSYGESPIFDDGGPHYGGGFFSAPSSKRRRGMSPRGGGGGGQTPDEFGKTSQHQQQQRNGSMPSAIVGGYPTTFGGGANGAAAAANGNSASSGAAAGTTAAASTYLPFAPSPSIGAAAAAAAVATMSAPYPSATPGTSSSRSRMTSWQGSPYPGLVSGGGGGGPSGATEWDHHPASTGPNPDGNVHSGYGVGAAGAGGHHRLSEVSATSSSAVCGAIPKSVPSGGGYGHHHHHHPPHHHGGQGQGQGIGHSHGAHAHAGGGPGGLANAGLGINATAASLGLVPVVGVPVGPGSTTIQLGVVGDGSSGPGATTTGGGGANIVPSGSSIPVGAGGATTEGIIHSLGQALDASVSDADGVARCPYPNCNKTFAKNRTYNLKAHLRSHSQLKPFACASCPRAFSRKHDLERHARVHSGDKPYICEVCGRGFPRSDALRRHWRVEKECGQKAAELEAQQSGNLGGDLTGGSGGEDDSPPPSNSRHPLPAAVASTSHGGSAAEEHEWQ